MGRLENKVALITGAAQGIGRHIAEGFALESASVVIADVQEDKGNSAVASIRKSGGNASFVHADVGDEQQIKNMIDHAARVFGTLDILINNAAPSRSKISTFEESLEQWDVEQSILLKAHALGVKHAAPYMEELGAGSIVNIASVIAFVITKHESCAYHVAKAGVIHLTRYLAHEFGPRGIRVNCVCPGLVDRDEEPRLTSDPVNRAVAELSVPLKRAGRAIDVANAALFLCTDEASYITGQSLVVDGGLALGEQFGLARRAYWQAMHDDV